MIKKYFKEIFNIDTIRTDYGFIQFLINEKDKECYIANIYVEPESRGRSKYKEMYNTVYKIAKRHECKHMTCETDITQNQVENATKAILNCGFKIINLNGNKIVFYKEIV